MSEASSTDIDTSQLSEDSRSGMQVDESSQNEQSASIFCNSSKPTSQTSSMLPDGAREQATTSAAQKISDGSLITQHAQTRTNENEACDNLPKATTSASVSQNRDLTKSSNETGGPSSSHTPDTGISAKERRLSVLKSERSPLYTLNPFCIPVKYLNISTPKT